jgi:hypothetical protein
MENVIVSPTKIQMHFFAVLIEKEYYKPNTATAGNKKRFGGRND